MEAPACILCQLVMDGLHVYLHWDVLKELGYTIPDPWFAEVSGEDAHGGLPVYLDNGTCGYRVPAERSVTAQAGWLP